MPSAAEIDVEECAAPNGSYSLSARLVKPEQAAARGERANAVAAVGKDLVRIGLMADVQNKPVGRGVEHIVQRHRQLDHAKAGAEMAGGDGARIDRLLAQFVGELPQLTGFEAP